MNRVPSDRPSQSQTTGRVLRTVTAGMVIVIGLILSAPQELFPPRQVISTETGLLDLSCAIEPALRLHRREYAGRDFIFTYGPLAQLIHGSWASSNAADVPAVMRWYNVLPAWVTNIALWFVLAFTGAPLSWRAPAYLLWLLLWPYFHIKPIGGLLVVMTCAYVLDSVRRSRMPLALLLWAFAAPVLMLHVFDLGVITGAALVLTVIVGILFTWRLFGTDGPQRRRRLTFAAAAIVVGAGVLATTAIVPNPFQHYLRDSWEVAIGYSQTMALPLKTRHLLLLVFTAAGSVLLGAIFGQRWRLATVTEPSIRAGAFALLAAACYCLLMTRYGMTRSDADHIKGPVGTLVCVAGCFVPCYLRGSSRSAIWPAAVVWSPAVLLASWFYFDSIADQFTAIRKLNADNAELHVDHATIRDAIAAAKQLPENSLYVWPYESIVGLVSDKSNPAYTMQAYAAHTPYLEEKTVARLQNATDTPVMYFVNTYPIDDVEHLTRTPQIFRYLVENYAIASPRHKDFLILRFQPGRKEQWRETELLKPEKTFVPSDGNALKIDFPDAAAACRASDLLVLRMSLKTPALLKLPKPGNLYVTLILSNGEARRQKVLLPPDGDAHDVILSACSAQEPPFWSIFNARRLWRSTTHVVGLKVEWEPMDRLSQRPKSITLHSISTLHRSGAEVRETGLAQAQDPELYDWCFAEPATPPP